MPELPEVETVINTIRPHIINKEIEKIELADLIILDINLPDGNGFEYLKKLRETYETPVLILTANDPCSNSATPN